MEFNYSIDRGRILERVVVSCYCSQILAKAVTGKPYPPLKVWTTVVDYDIR